MLQFVRQKIWNKKWLNLCLLAGIMLLVTFFACHPMLERGSGDQLLQTACTDYAEDNHEYPAVFTRVSTLDIASYPTVDSVLNRLDAYESKWNEYVDADKLISQQSITVGGMSTESDLGERGRFFNICYMKDMEEHVEVVDGISFDEDTTTYPANTYPCMVSETTMDYYGIVVGEKFYMLDDEEIIEGNPIYVVIGVFKEKADGSNYWYHNTEEFQKSMFIEKDSMDALMSVTEKPEINYDENMLLDYTKINCDNAIDYMYYIEEFLKADSVLEVKFLDILKSYETQQTSIKTIIWILELPCILLLLFFIYMVSSQIISSEETEIAVLRSRGVTRWKVILLYALQFAVLALLAIIPGVLLGYAACKGAASTDAFLVFSKKDLSLYTFNWRMIVYALIGGIVSIIVMTIPVCSKSGMTIVEQKSTKRYNRTRPFWEKYFVDVILLAISIYLLHNYNKQSSVLALSIIRGESLDPIIFLDASLFVFSCGLVFLRLSQYLIMLIDRIGKKHWKPAMYASFLQIRRSYRKQGFISVFIILTIASGIFDANMARTMNENNEVRIAYNSGADIRLTENWSVHTSKNKAGEVVWSYSEPEDYQKYKDLEAAGVSQSSTRVINDYSTLVESSGKSIDNTHMMAIQTKEFGETAYIKKDGTDGVNSEHWYNALNALAADTEGVILTRNTANELGVSVGDSLYYTRYSPISEKSKVVIKKISAHVAAIVDAFPGFEQYYYETDEDGNIVEKEAYLIVANYATVINEFTLTPYDIWMNVPDGVSPAKTQQYMEDAGLKWASISSEENEINKSRSSAMIQITNGMFTLSFLISIIICSVGFLIYWIMSIKKRELLFGVYRAMGMRMGEINQMLINEHLFSSFISLIVGVGSGVLSTVLFVQLITLVYLPKRHNIGLGIYVYGSDMIKLCAVILVVMLVCILVIRRILGRMNIAHALKLGED